MLASLFGFLYVLLGLETYSPDRRVRAVPSFLVLMVLTQLVRWPGPAGGYMSPHSLLSSRP